MVAVISIANACDTVSNHASVWYNGHGVPAVSLGVNTDYYLNTNNYDIFYKTGGCWTKIGNIMGATGTTGAQGLQGIQGPAGPMGATGAAGPQGPMGLTGQQGLIGPQGQIGLTGKNGTNGIDGKDGAVGLQGIDGSNGINGSNGKDGINGVNGKDGTDGVTTIVYIPVDTSTPWGLIFLLLVAIIGTATLVIYGISRLGRTTN